jgi:transcriptional antiterminator RfaH
MSSALESSLRNRKIFAENKSAGWFCLQTQPKHEHLAAAHLRKMDRVEVFLPRIRFKRAIKQAHVWVTEALFPGYLFVRFDWDDQLRQVQSGPGVRHIVHFGDDWPVISETTIDELRKIIGATGLHTIAPEFSPGDAVQFSDRNLGGLNGIVSRVMPGQKRVEVLMEILGRETGIELAIDSLIKEGCERAALFRH